eukprot:scaffold16854_cov39-Tisochrysis_lutea.AAC.1
MQVVESDEPPIVHKFSGDWIGVGAAEGDGDIKDEERVDHPEEGAELLVPKEGEVEREQDDSGGCLFVDEPIARRDGRGPRPAPVQPEPVEPHWRLACPSRPRRSAESRLPVLCR